MIEQQKNQPISPAQLLENFRETLAKTEGVDLGVLEIISDELLQIGADEKQAVKTAHDRLLKLAQTRSEEVNDSK